MNRIKKIFGKNNGIVIGAIHFPPLLGYPDFPGFRVAIENAIKDLKSFEKGGVDGVIFENNYDIPHKVFVDSEIATSMVYLGEKIKNSTKLPVGISVLWNDYKTALSIAKILNLQFIRVPVFIDDVKTDYGMIKGDAKKIISFRKMINAEDIAIFTDIHVKHSKLLSKFSIGASAKLAVKNKSDAIIITGKWTGESPNMNELKEVRKAVDNFPILVGSGTDKNNIAKLFEYANGSIVSTSLKKGNKTGGVNLKAYSQRIDIKKVSQLSGASNRLRVTI